MRKPTKNHDTDRALTPACASAMGSRFVLTRWLSIMQLWLCRLW